MVWCKCTCFITQVECHHCTVFTDVYASGGFAAEAPQPLVSALPLGATVKPGRGRLHPAAFAAAIAQLETAAAAAAPSASTGMHMKFNTVTTYTQSDKHTHAAFFVTACLSTSITLITHVCRSRMMLDCELHVV